MRRRAAAGRTIAGILVALFSVAESRPGTGQEQKALRHDVAAVVKLVPVRVLGPDGRPVKDLKREDFTLYDNDVLQKVTEFEVHAAPVAGAPAKPPVVRVGPPDIAPSVPGTDGLGRRIFLLFDVQGEHPLGHKAAREAALRFVETRLAPEELVGVLRYAPMTGLSLIQYLTADREAVKKAIGRANEIYPSSGETIVMSADDEPGGDNVTADWGVLSVTVPGTAAFARTGRDFEINMGEVAKALRYIPGAKTIILFSVRGAGAEVGREFAASNTPVFAVNTGGWIEKVKTLSPSERKALEDSPLKDLAAASGGKYYARIEDMEAAAADIDALTSNFYVLGYYIKENWDGRFHKIRVEVARPGCRVHVQEGYYEGKPFSQYSDLEKDLHLFGLLNGDERTTPDLIEADIDALPASDAHGSTALVLARVPVDEKTGLPPSAAELYFVVFDRDRRPVASLQGVANLSARRGKILVPYALFGLPPGGYDCRFAARDPAGGRSLSGRTSFEIREPADAALVLSPPLLLVPGLDPWYLQLKAPKKNGPPAGSLIDAFPLLPKACVPAAKTLGSGDRRLLAVLPARVRGEGLADRAVEVTITREGESEGFILGHAIVDIKSHEGGRITFLLEIRLPELSPGSYALEIAATDPATEERAAVSSRIVKI